MLFQKLAILSAVFQSCAAHPPFPGTQREAIDELSTSNDTLVERDDTYPLDPIERGMLDEQQKAYPGIYWYAAYPGGAAPRGEPEDGGCLVKSSLNANSNE